jgi:hypothetical protein
LSEASVVAAGEQLVAAGIEAVAICPSTATAIPRMSSAQKQSCARAFRAFS